MIDLSTLSPRQRELFILIGLGLDNQEIAAKAGLTKATVKVYISALMKRIGLNRYQIIREAVKLELQPTMESISAVADVALAVTARELDQLADRLASTPAPPEPDTADNLDPAQIAHLQTFFEAAGPEPDYIYDFSDADVPTPL